MTLVNGGDTLSVQIPSPSSVLDTVTYTNSTAGQSWSLDPDFLSGTGNDDFSHWCLGQPVYGTGDRGTPKSANDQCP